MSSTNRGAARRPADDYPTAPWPTRALLRAVPSFAEGLTVDPCAGEGVILRVLKDAGAQVAGIELRPECEPRLREVASQVRIGNALEEWLPELTHGMLGDCKVVTNPPFSLTREFIEAWAFGRQAAFLLPSSYYRGQGAAEWWQGREPSALLQLPRRPAFVAVCRRGGKKGCGASYPLGTRGACVCGGTIADGTDSQDYLWALWGVRLDRPVKVLPMEWCV